MKTPIRPIVKKLFLLTLVLLFLLPGCKQGDDPNEIVTVHCLTSVQITGDDPITYNFTYDAQGNLLTSDRTRGYRDVYTYDEACNVLTHQVYTPDNALLSDYRYVYDSRGNLLTEQRYAEGTDGSRYLSQEFVYTYDDKGNKLSERKYNVDNADGSRELISEAVYTYDDRGNVLTEVENGTHTSYTYDKHNNRTCIDMYFEDSQHTSKNLYTYDARGNMLTAVSYFNGKTEPGSQRIFTYDKRGNKLTETWYRGDQVTWNTDWVYDSAGNCTDRFEYINQVLTLHCAQAYSEDGKLLTILLHETSASASGEKTSYTEYTYNEEGLLCDYKYYNGGENEGRTLLQHNTFDYDQYGNLIRKNEAEYTYLSVSIPRYLAEKVEAQQEDLRHEHLVYTLHP